MITLLPAQNLTKISLLILLLGGMAAFYFGSDEPLASAEPRQDNLPGLGNLTYPAEEHFEAVGRIRSPHGHASVAMVNGYLVSVFSSDGGGNLDDGGIDIFDVSDPRNPGRVRRIEADITHELREAHSLSFSNSYGDRDFMVLQAMHGLQIWDVSDPPNMWPSHYLRLPGIREDDYFGAWWIFWQAPYIYLAGVEQGLYIIDATDIDNPQLVRQVPTSELGGINPAQVFIVGNMMVLATNVSAEFATVDISDPVNPKLLQYYKGHDAYSHTFAAGKIFGSGGRRAVPKLYIYDVTHDGQVSEYAALGEGLINGGYGTYQDGYFFSGFSQGVYKFDVENKKMVGGWLRDFTDRDYDFGIVLGNLVLAGEDHYGISELVVHQTEPDTKGPEVHWVHPADGASDQAVTSRVGLSMSDNVDINSVSIDTFTVRPLRGQPISGKYSSQLGIVNFFPDEPLLYGVTYEIEVEGIKDYLGNPSPQFVSTFTVGDPSTVNLDCTFAPAPALVGEKISYKAPSNPAGTIYQWGFGDGSGSSYSTSGEASHTYSEPGRYRVYLDLQRSTLQESCVGIQIVTPPPTENQPAYSSSMASDGANLFVANPDNNTVTAIDQAELEKSWEVDVCQRPETATLAPNQEVWVACSESDQIYRLDRETGNLISKISFDYGASPHAVVFAPDQSAAYVTLYESGELVQLAPSGQQQGTVAVGSTPRSLSISGDGERLFVSRYISGRWSGEVVEVDAGTFEIVRRFPLEFDPGPDHESGGRGVPNYIGQMAISPDGTQAILPSKKDNVSRGLFRDGQPLTFESQVRPLVSIIDLELNRENRLDRIDLDNEALPQTSIFSPLGDLFFVANLSSNSIHVYDSVSHKLVSEIATDFAPMGMVIDADTDQLFVHNFLSRNVSVHDISLLLDGRSNGASRVGTIDLVANEQFSAEELRGKQIFYNGADAKMSKDNYMSCAVCHVDGDEDGRIWDSTQDGEGLRNTPTLHGRTGLGHGNLHWSGAFDELQDVENEIRERFAGQGFLSDTDYAETEELRGATKAGRSSDLDALAAYVATLNNVGRSLYKHANGALTESAIIGRDLFVANGCATCHSGETFTDSPSEGRHSIGSAGRGSNLPEVDTPTLRGVWSTAPYLHDGSAETLSEAVQAHVWTDFSGNELEHLTAYLREIDDQEVAPAQTANQNPMLTDEWSKRQTSVNDGVWLQAGASDPDGSDTLTFGAINLPPGLGLNPETGEIIGSVSEAGRYPVTLFVSDGNGGADVAQFDWIVGAEVELLTGENHFCDAQVGCVVNLGWLNITVPSGTFTEDVYMQARSLGADGSSQESTDLLHPFALTATSVASGASVQPIEGQRVSVTYGLDQERFSAVAAFRLEISLRSGSGGLDSVPYTTEDGWVQFELDQLGEIGLATGRNIIFLPMIR